MALDSPTTKKRRLQESVTASENSSEPEDIHTKIGLDSIKSKRIKHIPKFRLRGTTAHIASLNTPSNDRVPLTLTDIQHLLLHSLFGNLNLSQSPRWYTIDKCSHISQTTCLVLEGMSIHIWEKLKPSFPFLNKIFSDFVEILTPSHYKGSLVDELALVPLSESEKESLIIKYGSMNLAMEARKDLNVMMRAVFPISNSENESNLVDKGDKYPRTQLIMSAWQLIEQNYPLPLKGKLQKAYSDYVMTKDTYQPVTAKSPMFAVDCEMCITSAGSELTRISVVNEKHETVYESLVKPYNKIKDYLTRFSGVTKELLENVDKRLEDVQNDLKALLPPDAILVGQSLNSDLHALKMMHPYIIDTSLIFSFTGDRNRKPKLKFLVKEFLKEDIQCSKAGHCSVEDALATIKLVQLKLSKDIEFGDAVHTNKKKYKENVLKMTTSSEYACSIFNHIIEQKKTSIIIGCDDITGEYHTYLSKAKENVLSQLKKVKTKKVKLSTVDNKQEVISSLCDAVNNYNYAMAHIKLESEDSDQICQIDKWVETVWKALKQNSLFVVIFGGSTDSNGLAMISVKSNL